MKRVLLLSALLAVLAGPALAVNPDEILPDPAMESRARALSRELRCVVCQNQSIDESDAALAHDLRTILRERLLAGDTDAEAKAYLVQRYGDFVLLNPRLGPDTLALWLGPLAILLLGGVGVGLYLRGRTPAADQPLDPAQQAQATALLNTEETP